MKMECDFIHSIFLFLFSLLFCPSAFKFIINVIDRFPKFNFITFNIHYMNKFTVIIGFYFINNSNAFFFQRFLQEFPDQPPCN